MTTQADTTLKPTAQNKGGAPKNNRNAERHGLRSIQEASRRGLTLYPMPKGCGRIGRDVAKHRRALEDAVLAAKGAISLVDASTINRACRSETVSRLAARWLALEGDTMTAEQRIQYMRAADAGTVAHDRAVSDLALEEKHLAGLWALSNGGAA